MAANYRALILVAKKMGLLGRMAFVAAFLFGLTGCGDDEDTKETLNGWRTSPDEKYIIEDWDGCAECSKSFIKLRAKAPDQKVMVLLRNPLIFLRRKNQRQIVVSFECLAYREHFGGRVCRPYAEIGSWRLAESEFSGLSCALKLRCRPGSRNCEK